MERPEEREKAAELAEAADGTSATGRRVEEQTEEEAEAGAEAENESETEIDVITAIATDAAREAEAEAESGRESGIATDATDPIRLGTIGKETIIEIENTDAEIADQDPDLGPDKCSELRWQPSEQRLTLLFHSFPRPILANSYANVEFFLFPLHPTRMVWSLVYRLFISNHLTPAAQSIPFYSSFQFF